MNGVGEKGSGKSKRKEVRRLGVGSGGKADQIKPCGSSRGCWLSLWVKWEMTEGFVQKWDVIWFELATVWRRVQVGISWGAWRADPGESWEGPGKMEKGWGPSESWAWLEGRTIRADNASRWNVCERKEEMADEQSPRCLQWRLCGVRTQPWMCFSQTSVRQEVGSCTRRLGLQQRFRRWGPSAYRGHWSHGIGWDHEGVSVEKEEVRGQSPGPLQPWEVGSWGESTVEREQESWMACFQEENVNVFKGRWDQLSSSEITEKLLLNLITRSYLMTLSRVVFIERWGGQKAQWSVLQNVVFLRKLLDFL